MGALDGFGVAERSGEVDVGAIEVERCNSQPEANGSAPARRVRSTARSRAGRGSRSARRDRIAGLFGDVTAQVRYGMTGPPWEVKRVRGLVWLACSGILNKRSLVPLTIIRNMVPFAKGVTEVAAR